MAECGSWQSIQMFGLLSTTVLLNLFELPDPQHSKIASEQRTDSVSIQHPEHGIGVIYEVDSGHLQGKCRQSDATLDTL